jgi:imidazolonepropionase-like amidohydrolase
MAVMIDIAKEFGYRVTAFHHAIEAYKIAPCWPAKASAPHVDRLVGLQDGGAGRGRGQRALVDAPGLVRVIHSDDAELTQRLNQEAAAALAAGAPRGMNITEEHAISWITLNPAKALGIADQTGSLEAGKRADVVIWSAIRSASTPAPIRSSSTAA